MNDSTTHAAYDAISQTLKWNDVLQAYPDLFDQAFLQRWGDETWALTEEDGKAAARLYTQMVSRITTQKLGYLDGDEKTALTSVYKLFDYTREVCDDYLGATAFHTLAWHVLNTYVRPFTAKWHRESERGGLSGLDSTDEFRAGLTRLQRRLESFAKLLLFLRDGKASAAETVPPSLMHPVVEEMRKSLAWGIPGMMGGIQPETADLINTAEKAAVKARRGHYGIGEEKTHALGLACSGGGIRSATFSLGVLVALAGRGILPQFDYLSTVSGGGYLGSFLTTFLNTPKREVGRLDIGLGSNQLPFKRDEGEAEALRHLRHHSKYLAYGSLWERVKMLCAQLYGMALNSMSVLFLAAIVVLVELLLRLVLNLGSAWAWTTGIVAIVFMMMGVVAPRFLRADRKKQKLVDAALTAGASVLVTLLLWKGLEYCHDFVHEWHTGSRWIDKSTVLAILGFIPVISAAVPGIFGKLLERAKLVWVLIAAIAAPLFFFGLYLAMYEFAAGEDQDGDGANIGILLAATAILGIIYLYFININFTSPHRLYRRKLAEAYLIQPAASPKPGQPFDEDVTLKLSQAGTERTPYHLINTALNVPGSTNPGMQGRLTDFFLFSPAYTGSPLTGYHETKKWEDLDDHLDVGTAMAISAAAAAPQMGLGTKRNLSFWMVLMNIRLGYWVRDPAKKEDLAGESPGILYLLKEMLGSMDEKAAFLNLSDGGHLENLAVYELLRRRCQFIVAIDGEEDGRMTFAGLTTLQRLAYIDLGIRIDASLDDLRLNDQGLSRSHFRFCRIHYPSLAGRQDEGGPPCIGYLLYVKLSLTGNEGEFLRRYRLDEPAFPHHSTGDQFFSEAQFEAYRALGEHVGDKLFMPALVGDALAASKDVNVEEWFEALGTNLLEPRA